MKGPQKCKFKRRWFRNEETTTSPLAASYGGLYWAASSALRDARKAAKERADMLKRDRIRNGNQRPRRRSIKKALGL